MKTLITPYQNPDMDGFACAYSYAEYLTWNGKHVVAGIFGKPRREVLFVLDKFDITPLGDAEKFIEEVDEIILVDASDLRGLSKKINPKKVIELIDHRKVHEGDQFLNAKKQIELVGSAATLIAEKFYENKCPITEKSATLLFSAIASNTINFKANVTTNRDRRMAAWLKTQFDLPENYVSEMFKDKSNFKKSIKESIIEDFATFNFNGHELGIAQLEIVEVNKFIEDNLDELRTILEELKEERGLNFIFLTCIDLNEAFNKFVVIQKEVDEENNTKNLLEKSLGARFDENGIAKKEGISMRKEIVPLVKEVLDEMTLTTS
jgi:manganese-dependent inorganic pyrophosphatase